ncbi:MAG: hypothetical protein ACFE9R_03120 [Candidatus Hermodarchaeota archaeon]
MGKEKEKDKDKKDKDKDKDKEKKEKDKDKDKEKKDKDKEKDKDKDKEKKEKDKDKEKDKEKKDKEKEKVSVDQEWKLAISKNLDSITHTYEKITNKFRDIDNYILKDAKSKEEFIEKVKKIIEDVPEDSKQIFLNFLQTIN